MCTNYQLLGICLPVGVFPQGSFASVGKYVRG